MVKRSDTDRNVSRKRHKRRYKRMSIKARMRKVSNAKPPPKQPWLTQIFQDPHFSFSLPPVCARSFLRAFCERYIFDMRVLHLYIPSPYCMHLYLEACYTEDLLQGEDVLAKTHTRYFIKGDFTRGIFRMPAKERMFWSSGFRRGKGLFCFLSSFSRPT
jgi:hypothetical protein